MHDRQVAESTPPILKIEEFEVALFENSLKLNINVWFLFNNKKDFKLGMQIYQSV